MASLILKKKKTHAALKQLGLVLGKSEVLSDQKRGSFLSVRFVKLTAQEHSNSVRAAYQIFPQKPRHTDKHEVLKSLVNVNLNLECCPREDCFTIYGQSLLGHRSTAKAKTSLCMSD